MRTPRAFPQEGAERVLKLLKKAKTKLEFQRIQCIWMRLKKNLSAPDIADLIGWHVSSVRRVHAQYYKDGDKIFKGVSRGGRHRENLSKEEEEKLLKQFFNKAKDGGILVVNEIKLAYELKVGHKVPKSTVYRMLARHDWRKIVPYRRHPKADLDKQAAFKKNFG